MTWNISIREPSDARPLRDTLDDLAKTRVSYLEMLVAAYLQKTGKSLEDAILEMRDDGLKTRWRVVENYEEYPGPVRQMLSSRFLGLAEHVQKYAEEYAKRTTIDPRDAVLVEGRSGFNIYFAFEKKP